MTSFPLPATTDPKRPGWDEWALALADTVALRADCRRRKVGAVALDIDHRVVAVGYNGAASGRPGCLTDGACPRGLKSYAEVPSRSAYTGAGECIALHAEANLVIYAKRSELDWATIYVTCEPCHECRRLLSGTPAERVIWPDGELILRRWPTNVLY